MSTGATKSGPLKSPQSSIPDFYYVLFAFYEPALTILGFIGALCDPETTHNTQAPWPANSPPPTPLPRASVVTVVQLAHVCALMGLINFFMLTAARRHLASQVIMQEKIVRALLIPLLIGDVVHLYVTLWALGDERWDSCALESDALDHHHFRTDSDDTPRHVASCQTDVKEKGTDI
ncbi:hypothetical protein F5141DRAFT_1216513 [Pisolithus sp. B1]|nr:hypothetical protein F5141DRAFT_1216513 [Pisolithus sp. B1]